VTLLVNNTTALLQWHC